MGRKIMGIILAGVMLFGVLAGCGENRNGAENSDTGSDTTTGAATRSGVQLTFLNSKSEIQTQLEAIAKEYEALTGVPIEVYATTEGASPFETIQKKYSAGDPPTLAMLDSTDIYTIAGEKGIDLSDEKWADDGGWDIGISMDGTLYSFPFCVEGRGLIYNKTAIEETLGGAFEPSDIKSLDDLKALFEKLKAGGMEYPMIINKEDWSLGAHFLQLAYEEQDGTEEGAAKLVDGLKNGTVKLIDNERFNSLFDTFDVLADNNMNKADPMAADYDLNAAALAEGTSAFWFNGNWSWAEISEYADDSTEFGIIPVVQNTSAGDFANTQITAQGSKQIMIDREKATPEQQQAAKDFLNWLVYDEKGQDALVNKCNLVPAFKNITLELTNPLGTAIKDYVDRGEVFDGYNFAPGDHWSQLGASMQKYLAKRIDRAGLASEIEAYWKSQ